VNFRQSSNQFRVEGQDKITKMHHRKIEPSIQDPDQKINIHFGYKVARRLHSRMFEM
jgi:hypothetical protein